MWYLTFERVLPYIVRVETPVGSGSGFLFATNDSKAIVAFATAAHVVEHVDKWKLPLKLVHHETGNEIFVPDEDRFIEIDSERDTASIVLARPGTYLPNDLLPLTDTRKALKPGVDVAWAGYPAIASPHLCLFTGTTAAFVAADDSYLIDGVAINGVSGGPVFHAYSDGSPEILGTISAYIPNRLRGDALPGIMQAHDVTSLQETISTIRSIDEARRKKEEEEKERRQAEAAGEVQAAPGSNEAHEPKV